MTELFDLFSVFLIQIGNYLKIKKLSYGWLLSLIAIFYFILRAFSCGLYSQSLGHCISFSLALYGFISWRVKEKEK